MQAALYRRLSELLDRSRIEKKGTNISRAKKLFEALDWGDRSAFSIEGETPDRFSLRVENCPVVSVVAANPRNITKVYSELNVAYNRDIPWVVATDFNSLGLFGSYWVSRPDDITSAVAWQLTSEEFLLDAPKLALLTPTGIAKNQLGQLYDAFPFRTKRQPIDLHLVERMSRWRMMALQSLGTATEENDARIYQLINGLILVRFLEDSGHFVDKLQSYIDGSKTTLTAQLKIRFSKVREIANYPVLNVTDLNGLDGIPLRSLISEMYGYKEWGINYDFSAISVDILGRFYEEYLRYTPRIRETRPINNQADMLFDDYAVSFDDIRKSKGIFYTPDYLVHYIAGSLIRKYEATNPTQCPVVADLSCGSGPFLVAALHEMLRRPLWRKDAMTSIVGLDADSRAVEGARLNLVAKCLVETSSMKVPQLNLFQFDLLRNAPIDPSLSSLTSNTSSFIDIVVGNPPYIKYERLIKDYTPELIKLGFEFGDRRVDSYILFIEASIKILKSGGFCGLVLPQAFLQSSSAGRLREWLTQQADLLEVVDFQDQPVFQGVGVYICIILLRKKGATSTPTQATIGKIFELSDTPASQLAQLSMSTGYEEQHEVFRVDQPTNTSPWIFRNQKEKDLLKKLSINSTRLGDTGIKVSQGVKTGADDVFVINEETYFGSDRSESTLLEVEKSITIPVFRGRDLRRWASVTNSRLIYPYDTKTKSKFSWSALKKEYPKCAKYLEKNRLVLEKRKSLNRESWYELIRPRTSSLYDKSPKLYISELCLRPSVSYVSQMSAILGSTGGGSWLIIEDSKYEKFSLMAYLNSSISDWFLRQVAPVRRGGWILVEQKAIIQLPIPNFLTDKKSFARSELSRLGEKLWAATLENHKQKGKSQDRSMHAWEEQIDSVLMESLEFSSTEAQYVRDRVFGISE